MSQLGLSFDAARERSIDERFRAFHQDNPHVYAELVRLARLAKSAGRTSLGIRMLWERMRWTFSVETVRAEGEPKLNDHFTSRFARLIQTQESDLAGLFETRELRS